MAKKNPADLTLRNLRAQLRRNEALAARVRDLTRRIVALEKAEDRRKAEPIADLSRIRRRAFVGAR